MKFIVKSLTTLLMLALATSEPPVPNTAYGVPGATYGAPLGPSSVGGFSGQQGQYAQPAGHGVNGGHGGHGGHGDHGYNHEDNQPKSYEFGYAVKDDYSGNDYGRKETSDGNAVRGEYRVNLPDGRVQIVTYYADWRTGFHADVKYEGEAKYPDTYKVAGAPSGQYGAPSSGYGAPAAAPIAHVSPTAGYAVQKPIVVADTPSYSAPANVGHGGYNNNANAYAPSAGAKYPASNGYNTGYAAPVNQGGYNHAGSYPTGNGGYNGNTGYNYPAPSNNQFSAPTNSYDSYDNNFNGYPRNDGNFGNKVKIPATSYGTPDYHRK